jgi:protein disulfide-isomerase-like protein
VVDLTPDNFDEFVGGDAPAFVEFFAPWCGHCKALAPEYEVVGSTFAKSDGVVVAKVDADAHRDLAGKFEVRGYPTLKWFPKGSTTPEDYTGGRSADDIVQFINDKTGLRKRVKAEPTPVKTLTPDNFEDIVMNEEAGVLVEFYAPWCGHCKALAPTYKDVAATYAGDDNVVIAALDADKYRDLAQQYDVSGFPTLKWFGPGPGKAAEAYEGGRDGESFVDFVNSRMGTRRVLGGGVTDDFGTVSALDELAEGFLASEAKEDVLAQAEEALGELEGEEEEHGKYYVKVMKRVVEKGEGWASKETSRLESMVEKDSVKASTKTSMLRRLNVLRSF